MLRPYSIQPNKQYYLKGTSIENMKNSSTKFPLHYFQNELIILIFNKEYNRYCTKKKLEVLLSFTGYTQFSIPPSLWYQDGYTVTNRRPFNLAAVLLYRNLAHPPKNQDLPVHCPAEIHVSIINRMTQHCLTQYFRFRNRSHRLQSETL